MLGWVAAVSATDSPSQLSPPFIQRMCRTVSSAPIGGMVTPSPALQQTTAAPLGSTPTIEDRHEPDIPPGRTGRAYSAASRLERPMFRARSAGPGAARAAGLRPVPMSDHDAWAVSSGQDSAPTAVEGAMQASPGSRAEQIEVVPLVVVTQAFPTRPSSLPDIRDFVRRRLTPSALSDEDVRTLGERVAEVLLAAAGESGMIQVSLRIFPAYAEVDVFFPQGGEMPATGRGAGTAPSAAPPRPPDRPAPPSSPAASASSPGPSSLAGSASS